MLGFCHWQPDAKGRPTLLLVHGLEGCSESHYMLGLARKAWRAGFNVIRLNQRNCGGTERHTPTLYNGGLSGDLYAIIAELARDGLDAFWVTGYSMGGNLVLRLAGQVGPRLATLRGVVAVCPNIDPAACVAALEERRNWIYHTFFLRSLQARLRRKARLFPGKFDVAGLNAVRTLRAFDEAYTAPDGGYRNAADYYEQSGARRVLADIAVPVLIITAQDDPFIPYRMFRDSAIPDNRFIRLLAPAHGGHCGFIQRPVIDEDLFWAENRILDFLIHQARAGHSPASRPTLESTDIGRGY
jgi:predicted alpha/beta-fold hydrolase